MAAKDYPVGCIMQTDVYLTPTPYRSVTCISSTEQASLAATIVKTSTMVHPGHTHNRPQDGKQIQACLGSQHHHGVACKARCLLLVRHAVKARCTRGINRVWMAVTIPR
jgi:hypothetical protein